MNRLAALLCLALVTVSRAEDLPELRARGGLPNFFAACAGTGEVRVAYFGGSITAAPGWRVQSREWFQSRWPGAKFSEIHAAIGGTGSDLGVFRCGRDVLAKKPHLVFVEFAVNDGGADPVRIHRGMEGIVRQIRAADPATDICHVYTIAQGMLAEEKAGKTPRSIAAMEQVAEHYGIPSIRFGREVAKREAAGELIFQAPKPEQDGKPVFSPDAVHPFTETGHKIYTEVLRRSFESMAAAPGAAGPHASPAPLRADNWEKAVMVDIRPEWRKGAWRTLDAAADDLGKRFASRTTLHQAEAPGAALEFAFTGTAVGVFDLVGPDGGQVQVWVDGEDKGLRPRFDAYCTYHRLQTLWVAQDLPPGRHTVRVELTGERFDKAAILAKRNEKMDDPARFAPLRWQAGAVLVEGVVE